MSLGASSPHKIALVAWVWRTGLFVLVLDLLLLPVSAQTVRPVLVEHKLKARSKFEIINDTIFPLNVVLDPKSFSIAKNGQVTFRPLDSHIHLKLSAMSFRLPPKQKHFIFYKANSEKMPVWFVLYCTFSGYPRQSGLNVRVKIPHTVYLVQKEPLKRSHVHILAVKSHPKSSMVMVELENTSARLGRVLKAEIRSKHHKRSHTGFPLLPQSQRRLQIPWDLPEPPEKLVLRFRDFTLKERLIASRE